MIKKLLFVSAIIIGSAIIELTSIAHPLERFILDVSHSLRGIQQASPVPIISPEDRAHERERVLSAENAELRKQLSFNDRSERVTVGADVAGYSTDPSRSLLIVNRGSRDGVTEGAPAMLGDGVLFARTTIVEDTQSMLLPLRDPKSKILVMILRDNDEPLHGIAAGRFNVGVDMTYVPITKELRVGDIVMTSGLQEGIPKGLIVGTIQEIRKKPEDLFQSAVLTIPYPDEPPSTLSIILEKNQ